MTGIIVLFTVVFHLFTRPLTPKIDEEGNSEARELVERAPTTYGGFRSWGYKM